MVITHTQTQDGDTRVYLGSKSSLECWIAPKADGKGWSFHMDTAIAGYPMTPYQKREWASHILLRLSNELQVSPHDLSNVPYEAIVALHQASPLEAKRGPVPRRKMAAHTYMATDPDVTRPSSDFSYEEYEHYRRHRR